MTGEDGFSLVSYKGKRKKHLKQICKPSLVAKDFSDSLQNFGEIMRDIQDELKHSEFVVHFKEDLLNVLNEWDLGHVINTQDSSCADTPSLPNGSQAVNNEMQDIDIVCYGLGQFFSCIIARYQLGFLLLLKHMLHSVHVHIYDPLFSAEEINFLKELGLNVLGINEEAKRTLRGKSICFMPHCVVPLYNNLLWANWNVRRLSELVIIGNSFQNYELNDAKGHLKEKAKYVYLANKFATEIRLTNVFRFIDVFNDLSIHYFKSSSLSAVDSLMWSNLEEPEYSDDDEIILRVMKLSK